METLEQDWIVIEKEPGSLSWGAWNYAPKGVLIEIFCFLDIADLGKTTRVCKMWRETVKEQFPYLVQKFRYELRRFGPGLVTGIICALGGMKAQNIQVYASSIWRGEAIDFISPEKVYVWTQNKKYSWFAVDLGESNKVRPTHYQLRYGSSGNKVPPRNWILQASNDPSVLNEEKPINETTLEDPRWVILKHHSNDVTINGSFEYGVWEIERRSSPKLFRIFRVLQIGTNKMPQNQQWNNVLVTSGFEIYGTLIQRQAKIIKPPSSPKFLFQLESPPDGVFQRLFQYRYDYDINGILYYLQGKVKGVYSSTIWHGTERDFISRKKTPVWTKNEPNSWFAVDFGDHYSILVTNYTMRYGSSGTNVPPRNWVLQGTNNPEALKHLSSTDWVDLSTHVNDQKINSEFGSHTWEIDLEANERRQFFRIFRILQTGKNKMPANAAWGDVLVASGFELYGYLQSTKGPSTPRTPPDNNNFFYGEVDIPHINSSPVPSPVQSPSTQIRRPPPTASRSRSVSDRCKVS